MRITRWPVCLFAACCLCAVSCNSDHPSATSEQGPPEIVALIADSAVVSVESRVGIACRANIPSPQSLTYDWWATGGELEYTVRADSVVWHAPRTPATFPIWLRLSNAFGSDSSSTSITVCFSTSPTIPPLAVRSFRLPPHFVSLNWSRITPGNMVTIERRLRGELEYTMLGQVPMEEGRYDDTDIGDGSVWEYRFSVAGCRGASPYSFLTVDREAPRLLSSYPPGDVCCLPVDTTLSFTFSEPLDSQRTAVDIEGPHDGTEHIVYGTDRTWAELSLPDGRLYPLVDYSVRLAAVDTSGNAFGDTVRFHCYESVTSFPEEVRDFLYLPAVNAIAVLTNSGIATCDFATGAVTHRIALDFDPTRIALNPGDGLYYVTSYEGHQVVAIDPATGTVVHELPVLEAGHPIYPARNPRSIAFSPSGIGLVEVQAKGISGAGHSLEEVAPGDVGPTMRFRPEFEAGRAPELDIVASDGGSCILLFHYNNTWMDTYRYMDQTDALAELGPLGNDYHLGCGAPLHELVYAMHGRHDGTLDCAGMWQTDLLTDELMLERRRVLLAFSSDRQGNSDRYLFRCVGHNQRVLETFDLTDGRSVKRLLDAPSGREIRGIAVLDKRILVFAGEAVYLFGEEALDLEW